ncbi:hypothetical protein [Sphingomonas quercus]|uniref:Uncharacterized protein n=1 Tax=Sphingomonas quercus TaxID=2842451 RepID=A0ABS6BDZ6_9SPHN|nr:hypothetical protein [Sphingomonas quercus]MBU3076533.1 hypothetical protein [Sphingomonas quercus]
MPDAAAVWFVLLSGLSSPALALPAVIGGFLLRRFRWIVLILALAVPALLWLAATPVRYDPIGLVMIPAAALWAWVGRSFGRWWGGKERK